MDIFRDSKRVIWLTLIRHAGQQPTAHTPKQKRLFRSNNHPGSMEAPMATHTILLVGDLGIEYVGERHIHHLRDVLKKHYKITEY